MSDTPMLGSDQLEHMREAQERLLLSSAAWAAAVPTDDGRGGRSTAYVAQGAELSPIPCRVSPPTRSELATFADRWQDWPGWVLTLPVDEKGSALVAIGDRLTVGALTYQVVGDMSEGQSLQTVRRLAVVRA